MDAPKTLTWFRRYCLVQSTLYLAVAIFGIVLLVSPPGDLDMEKAPTVALGVLFLLMGLLFLLLSLLGLDLPRRPGAWVIGLVLICLGISNIALLPFAIPLLVAWRKPGIQAWFGRNPS